MNYSLKELSAKDKVMEEEIEFVGRAVEDLEKKLQQKYVFL